MSVKAINWREPVLPSITETTIYTHTEFSRKVKLQNETNPINRV